MQIRDVAFAHWLRGSPCTNFPQAPGVMERELETRGLGPTPAPSATNQHEWLEQITRSFLCHRMKGREVLSEAPSCSHTWRLCEVRRLVSAAVFLALLCPKECFSSGFSFSCGLAQVARSPWVWRRTDLWLREENEIRAFELLESRNVCLFFLFLCFVLFSNFCFFKGFSPMRTFKKRDMLPQGWPCTGF